MTARDSGIDPELTLIADTSVVINLIATKVGARILAVIPNEFLVPEVVVEELERGRQRGRMDADVLAEWIRARHVRVCSLGGPGQRVFEELVVGAAADTLDDGEAATIGCCSEVGGVALIDERKALRICGSKYPQIRCASSIDVLMHPAVMTELGSNAVSDAVFSALQEARMRVWPEHVDAVIALIGEERARLCKSLPGAARS